MHKHMPPEALSVIRHAATLCLYGRGFVSKELIQAVINSAPKHPEEVNYDSWREESLCWRLLVEVHCTQQLYPWAQDDFDATADFWLKQYPQFPQTTRLGVEYFINRSKDLFAFDKSRTISAKDMEAAKFLNKPMIDPCRVLAFPTPPL